MTEKNNKLLEALSQFQGDNITAKKTAKNPFFKSDYANLDEVIQAVNHGAKYGLSFSQSMDYEITEHGTIQFVRTNVYHKECDNVLTARCIISVKGNKFDDSHAVGSAITYAKRYSLCAIYGLATADDDGNANAKKPKGNTATTYLDDDGIEQSIVDDAPTFPSELIPVVSMFITKFKELDAANIEDIRSLCADKNLINVCKSIKEHKVESVGNYQELLNLRENFIKLGKELKEQQEYANAKGL
tara:strand:+ start:2818 stop:3549 length:732 start_codon:yes stop_codon:yes gene_type:complete